ncbi:MAG: hypothetical protein HN919_18310 [Verrucomicrobia bacterium]|mgnify:CR=1 FL=1|jgi:hypothetical protein|nr:hypothetical protein [Verrucomicrobiota bacterium]MBT7068256.1 hypothetical protein [Verrucomicrobiota bacterium]MBT7699222.1 hypothetical protein [Verrucomicrobiota bacterium]
MKKLRIYLDTSVINFLFADDAPDFKRVTVEFFDRYPLRLLSPLEAEYDE